MHVAAAHHPPTTRRHYPAGQRMKGVVDRLFARQNPGAMSLSRPARAKPTWPSPSAPPSIGAGEADSSTPSISSTSSSRKSRRESGRIAGSVAPRPRHDRRTRLSALRASGAQLLFHLISGSMSTPLSSSRPISPSPNGAGLRRPEDDDRHARPAHAPLRHRRDWQRELALQEQLQRRLPKPAKEKHA